MKQWQHCAWYVARGALTEPTEPKPIGAQHECGEQEPF